MTSRFRRIVAAVLALGYLLAPGAVLGESLLSAQLTQEERAVPPPATPAVSIPPGEEARILLELAHRLKDQGETAAARIVLRDIVDRFDGTLAAAEALDELNRLPAAPPIRPEGTRPPDGSLPSDGRSGVGGLDQDGRIPIIIYSTLLASFVAVSIPIVADAEGSTPYGLSIMLGAPIGLLSSMYLTRNRKVTATQADLFTLSTNWGLFHGLALGIISDGDDNDVVGATALGGLIGAGAGALLISSGRNRESTVALASLSTATGAWLGLVGSQLTGGEEGPDENAVFTGMLIGGDAALMVAALTGPRVQLSRSRARLLGLGTIVGALAGVAFDLTFNVDGREEAWVMIGVGSLAGTAGAVALTSDYDAKRGFSEPTGAAWLPPDVKAIRGGVGLALLNARF